MQKKLTAAVMAAVLMVLGGAAGSADSRWRIWGIQDITPVFAEEKTDAAKSAVNDAAEYIDRWNELAAELALEETEDALLDMIHVYQNEDGLHLEWEEKKWAVVNKGDTSISVFGIRIGDSQSDTRKNVEAIKNKYNAYSQTFKNESSYQDIMMAVEHGYYHLFITYNSSGKISEWYFTNLLEGTYDDSKFVLDVQKKYGKLEEGSWKSAYICYLSELVEWFEGIECCLLHLNNDAIPELYIAARKEYVPNDYFLTLKNGKINELSLKNCRLDELSLKNAVYFIQKKNLFRYYEPASYPGTAKENIYTIKNGKFELKASGRIKSYNFGKRSYKWNGKKVSGTKYNKLLRKVYPIKKETSLKELKMYNINQIVKQIMES